MRRLVLLSLLFSSACGAAVISTSDQAPPEKAVMAPATLPAS
jgi:hypothetical protein